MTHMFLFGFMACWSVMTSAEARPAFQMKNLTKEYFVHILRYQSTGFSRGIPNCTKELPYTNVVVGKQEFIGKKLKNSLFLKQLQEFVHAVATGFDIDHMVPLVSFAECFGAMRLMEAPSLPLSSVRSLKRKHETGQWLDIEASETQSSHKEKFSFCHTIDQQIAKLRKLSTMIGFMSTMINALEKSKDHPNSMQGLIKASEKLGKVLNGAGRYSIVNGEHVT
ncbi:hypothetical protein ACS0TY_010654 [Phlomoides rotata]